MQKRSINKPLRINRDADEKYLPADAAFYMLNSERAVSSDGTLGKITPMASNELICEMAEEIGEGFWVGGYRSELTNEVYLFRFKTDGINYILRINGDSTCEVVYEGECLPLSAKPEHSIEKWRVYLKYDRICAHRHGKQLVWVDGSDNPIGMLDVEASIATNNFSTAFFDICPDDCAPLRMCVPEPCGALEAEFVPYTIADDALNNYITDKGFQFRFQHVYYDERASEWSDISSIYYQDTKGCFDTNGIPRCMKFRVPVGNPLVDKIRIAYSLNNGQQWYLYDTIDKYNPYTSDSQYWYERTLADLLNFSTGDCSFDYIFCNDKECQPIDPTETNRVFNPMPIAPQGFFRIKDSIAFYNYIKGNCPLLESETKKFEVSLSGLANQCNPELVTVTFFLIAHRNAQNFNMPIFRLGGTGGLNIPDDIKEKAYFGGAGYNGIATPHDGMGQYFRGDVRNFIGYVEGTDYFVEMKQYVKQATAGVPPLYLGAPIGGMSDAGVAFSLRNLREVGTYYFQQGTLSVPKGTKGFLRIASHLNEDGLLQSQDESTYVIGVIPSLISYQGLGKVKNISGLLDKTTQEIYFDTCDGDVYLDPVFIVDDNDIDSESGTNASSAVSGYIRDTNGNPLEGIEVWNNSVLKSVTDFNGFYHFLRYGGVNGTTQLDVRADQSSSGPFTNIKFVTVTMSYSNMTNDDITIDNAAYQLNFYEDVQVIVRDCDNEPVGGVRVAMSGSKYEVTEDVTGIATFKIRNYSGRNRVIRGVVMDGRNCFNIDCDGVCNFCLPKTALTALPSSFSGVHYTNLAVDQLLNLNTALVGRKGLKSGGLYEWGIVGKGDCGRVSAVYPINVMEGSLPSGVYMNVPKTQEKGSLSFNKVSFDGTGLVLPNWVKCVSIVRTKNNKPFVLQWVVDKIERLPGDKIRLTIQSLNDYNSSFDFRTNTSYDFLEGDRVEFISNGDVTIFDSAINGILNYKILSPFAEVIGEEEPPANFFNQLIIENDGRLNELTIGAKIELQRPKECTEENSAFFSVYQIPTIEVSGQNILAEPTGEFLTFDTYFVIRAIKSIPTQIFEHRNPSDFWGDALEGISDRGKVYFKNKYENERRFGRNITINSVNRFNRFGDLEKTLDAPEQGDLISVGVYDGKIGLGIGQNDNFLFQISDDFLRVGSDGVVRAAPPDALISDTEPKVSGMFGCQYEDVGSVFYGDGFVTWVDSKKSAFVKHDFNVAKDVSQNKMQSWFRNKIQRIAALNGTSGDDQDKFRWVTGFNYITNALQITARALTSPNNYNEKDSLLQDYETILLDPATEDFLTNAGYVQDLYSTIKTDDANGCAFISAAGNKVYKHPVIATTYNEFNGVATDWIVGIITNEMPDKIKVAISLEIQSEQRWYVTKVVTDNPDFESEIPPIRFNKTERKWNGSFLFNKNSVGGLYGMSKLVVGEQARGYYIKVTLIRDNTVNLAVNTLDEAKQTAYGELDMIITKHNISEQSGYTENL